MESEVLRENIKKAVLDVREKKPMAPSITNTVTVNLVANTQLAVGGSAAMVYQEDEALALASISDSFYINLGTIFDFYMDTFRPLGEYFNKTNHKWVLDPVAAGLGKIRNEALLFFKECKPSIIRGNASEILAVSEIWELSLGDNNKARGVESEDEVDSAREAAILIARETGGVVSVSGKSDLVTDGEIVVRLHGGSHYMEKITGAGCSLGGVCAVYECVTDPLTAAITASQIYNVAAKKAEERCKGPGSFEREFLDELYNVSADEVANNELEIEVL